MDSAAPPHILGLDEDRSRQELIAPAFETHGFRYRFLTEAPKLLLGIERFRPRCLLLFGETNTDFVNEALALLSTDSTAARLPVVLFCRDDAEDMFAAGLRTGLVALWKRPFSAATHPAALARLLADLPFRPGSAHGKAETTTLARLIEHLRRCKRTGALTLTSEDGRKGEASFVLGNLSGAAFEQKAGVEALVAMVTLQNAAWHFQELAGDGSGVVVDLERPASEPSLVMGELVGEEPPTEAFEIQLAELTPRPSAPPAHAIAVQPSDTLLLVDDDEALLRMFTTLFEKHGFRVVCARDGLEGYQRALGEPISAIVADLNMPRMDGWGMLRLLREDFRTREIPLAFLSCHDAFRDSLKAAGAGAQAYLSKDTKLDAVAAQIKTLLVPRKAFLHHLAENKPFEFQVDAIGAQWAIAALARHRFSGQLLAQDSWAQYRLIVDRGDVTSAQARSGPHDAESERAFNAFVASRAASARLGPLPEPLPPQNLFVNTASALEHAVFVLNQNSTRTRNVPALLGGELLVNRSLYELYAQVGPRAWLPLARMLCEERRSPRDIVEQKLGTAPEVEEVMRDLLRRGVLQLPPERGS